MSNKQIKVTLKTLTPLWTGDAWGRCEELKLTGIIGSLRWWFEALVRGMGYKACDSTGDRCQVEIKNPEDVLKIHKKICPVCYLFGTTGWKSRFAVSVLKNESVLSKPYNERIVVNINGGKSWYYESGLMGDATLKVQYDDKMITGELKEFHGTEKILTMKDVFPSILRILLYLISEYGMLGAKTSMGYGVVKFKIDNNDISVTEDDWKNFENYLKLSNKFEGDINRLPNLKDFFFVKFNVTDSIDNVINNVKGFFRYQDGVIETDIINKWKEKNWCLTSPVVRKPIRKEIKKKFKGNNALRHFLMGNIQKIKALKEKDPTRFSAIQVSHIYKKNNNLEFRIYGWLPDIKPINGNVDDIIKLLQKIFEEVPWKEKERKENRRITKTNYFPSQIQSSICWNSSNNLSLVNDNIKDLFNIPEVLNHEI